MSSKKIEEAKETMWHWVEWEKANKHKINSADKLIDIQTTVLQYIKQLESDKQKIIAFCEENKYAKIPGIKEMMEQILEIAKGEKECQIM